MWPFLLAAVPLMADARVLGEAEGPDEERDYQCPVCDRQFLNFVGRPPTCLDCKVEAFVIN